MAIKLGINGFGRIGKLVFRAAVADGGFEVVGINDLMDAKTMAILLKYDSTHGRFKGTVEAKDGAIVVNGKEIPITQEKDPAKLPWKARGAQIVLESTGKFATAEDCRKHIEAGAQKVLLSVPPKDKGGEIKTVVMGVNDGLLKPEDRLVSNASCTTNSIAPPLAVISKAFEIERGYITTVHAYTNDQSTLDQVHKDLRRARAAAVSIIPTSTGAARAIGAVVPELAGKLDGIALRVPTQDGSISDMTLIVKKKVTAAEVNDALKKAANGPMKGIMAFCEDPIVSADIVGDPHSAIIDGLSTAVMGDNFVKVYSWYDNEWGYSCRCIDLFKKMAR